MTPNSETIRLLSARSRLRSAIAAGFAMLVIAAAAISVFLLCYNYLNSPSAFNSDNLLSSAQCDDLLHGRRLTEWHLPGAPYLFPDLLFLIPCQGLMPTLPLAFLTYSLTIHLSLLSLVAWLGCLSGLSRRAAIILAACGALLLSSSYLKTNTGWAFLLVHPGSHVGAIVAGLFLLVLAAHALRRGTSWALAAMYLLAGGVGAFSDRLLIVQFLAPLALALILLAARRITSRKQAGTQLLLLASSLLLSRLLSLLFQHWGVHLLEVEEGTAQLRLADLLTLLRRIYDISRNDSLVGLLFALHLLAAFLVACCFFRRGAAAELDRTTRLLAALTLALSPLSLVGTLFVLGMSDHPAIDRYTLSCWYLPPLFLPLLLRWIPGRTAAAAGWLLQSGILLLALPRIGTLLPGIDPAKFEQPYPPLAQALDRLARERGPLWGLAGYWAARANGFFTRERVYLNPVSANTDPYFHACNPARFLSDDEDGLRVPNYQFLLVRPTDWYGPSAALFALQFGEPKEKIAVGGDEIWLYESLRIPAFDRFLRARLAERLPRRRPFTAPREPACLACPKANLSACNAPGTMALAPGQSCEVRFAQPITGCLLDIGASAEARLDATFFRSEKRISELRIPDVPWTGVNRYQKPGMQSRLVRLPAVLRGQSWDRLVLRLQGDSAEARLGHVLVFAESIAGLEAAPAVPRPARTRLEAEDLFPFVWCHLFTNKIDLSTSAGRYRRAFADLRGILLYVPPLGLPPGRYRLQCAMTVDDNCIAEPVASLIVGCKSRQKALAECSWRGADFAAPGRWQRQTLTFDIPADVEEVEFGLVGMGRASFSVDYLDLIAEPSP